MNKNKFFKQSGSFLLEAGIAATIIALTTIGGITLYRKTLAFQGSLVENQEVTAMAEGAIDTVRAYGRDYFQVVKEGGNNVDTTIQANFSAKVKGFANALADRINTDTPSAPGTSIWADWQSQYLTRRIKFTQIGAYDDKLKGVTATALVCWASQTGEGAKCTGQDSQQCIVNKCLREFPGGGQGTNSVFMNKKIDGVEINTIITAY